MGVAAKFQTFMSQSKEHRPKEESDSELVGFKLDDDNRAKLNAQAREMGLKRNLLARDFVLKALNEQMDLAGAVVTLNQQLFVLREELALVAEVLLSHGGKLTTQEAKKWADENIKPV